MIFKVKIFLTQSDTITFAKDLISIAEFAYLKIFKRNENKLFDEILSEKSNFSSINKEKSNISLLILL
jgi:hypothetical protein